MSFHDSKVENALRELKIKRAAARPPYPDWMNEREVHFLTDNGFTATDIKGLGIAWALDIGRNTPQVPYRLVKKLNIKDADGVFISCTDFHRLRSLVDLKMT